MFDLLFLFHPIDLTVLLEERKGGGKKESRSPRERGGRRKELRGVTEGQCLPRSLSSSLDVEEAGRMRPL
jgi:hypothetical protein